ncbi:Heat shock protein DnaJ [Cordyceps fumosorosea ARSEF 2679]|uniref:Heat shock protein DnaJ n=1 Tax=Cordyceps fumosorosea (strain ARSEF 2679) TaxID=1081104 RepID=A0A167ZE93_CORFA|nr:Heat shock protein DnaJ [Cordyceps fumosorosea ARSEF 2679]OAA67404.1 Heat shock protein DnaJ [Cordyceps fumosorosea ARSEF 2679]
MSDENKDVLRFAAEYAEKNVDLYDLLGVDALTSKDDIRRAWRKRSLKYHPDKAGDNFDPEKWELFERARDILADDNARATYDASMKAKLLRRQEREAMDKERKRFADDLEAAENAARQQQQAKQQRDTEMLQKERERLAELQRMRDEEAARQAQAAQEMDDMVEARRRLKERKEEKAKRREAKERMKASSVYNKKAKGPANGAVDVPGDFVIEIDGGRKMYWELVCDKLRARQAISDMGKEEKPDPHDAMDALQQIMTTAKQRIYDAELAYQRETGTA